jgi:hypothetical protein
MPWTETIGPYYRREGSGNASDVADANWNPIAPMTPGPSRARSSPARATAYRLASGSQVKPPPSRQRVRPCSVLSQWYGRRTSCHSARQAPTQMSIQ